VGGLRNPERKQLNVSECELGFPLILEVLNSFPFLNQQYCGELDLISKLILFYEFSRNEKTA